MDRSVVVIGGGAAGVVAALSARRAGAQVRLVRRSPGATALSSGAFDLAHALDTHGRPMPVADSARYLARTRRNHPYARLGEALGEALALAQQLLTHELHGLGVRASVPPGRNLRLATPLGTTHRAALAQGAIARGDLETLVPGARVGVVGLEGLSAFDARPIAVGLAREGFVAMPLWVSHPLPANADAAALAQSLDRPGGREPFAMRVLAAAREAKATNVLLPTAGLEAPEALCDELVQGGLAGAAELLGLPPSVPGLRLQRALEARLAAAHVEVLAGEAVGARVEGGQARAVTLADGTELAADAFVLATGRWLGGGLKKGATLAEPVFGLPVLVDGEEPGERWVGDLLAREVTGPHPALRAGVLTDGALRPLDERGRPVLANVFCAGAVTGGHDAATDASGLGVAAVTGVVAGRQAASR